MNGSFSASAVRLGDLLSGARVYATPGFQRPYSWSVVEVGRVLDDILFALADHEQQPDKDTVFFLGTIVLIRKPGDSANAIFDIVDGQQRFVTLTLMIAVLRDLARAGGSGDIAARLDKLITVDTTSGGRAYRVSVRERDEAVLAGYAKQINGCLAEADPEDFEGAQRDIILNRNYLIEELKGLDKEVRANLARYLEHHCQVVVISTDDTDNAFRIFNVVNQQGKPLSRNDLLKAELIGSIPAEERDHYIARWEQVEHDCGPEFEHLFSHVRTALGNGRLPIINEIRRLVRHEGGGKAFLDRHLLPMARIKAAMSGRVPAEPGLGAEELQYVRSLERLSHSDWVPAALAWLHGRRRAPGADRPGDDAVTFLAALDRLGYGQLLLGLGRDKRAARYTALTEAIRDGQTPHIERGAMAFSAEDRRNIIFNASNNLYGRSTIACKLLLLRINDVMGGGLVGIDPACVTVEHILPQRVGRNSRWNDAFSSADRATFAGSLGNLVLAAPETNKAARNSDFDRKVQLYREDAVMVGLPINQDVLALENFGPAEITAREARMSEIIRDLWGIASPQARRLPAERAAGVKSGVLTIS